MKWLTIDYIKQHSRIEYDCEDSLLELYGNSAEDTILNYLNRSYQDVLEEYGMVPEPLLQASLMLVDVSYTQRSPVSTQSMAIVPYTFDVLTKPYMRLASSVCDIPVQVFTLGSDIKILVSAELPDDLKMEDVDFTVVVYNAEDKNKEKSYDKSECIQTEDDEYMVLVDSDDLGVGTYMLRATFWIPDADYPTGNRKEVLRINPNIRVNG